MPIELKAIKSKAELETAIKELSREQLQRIYDSIAGAPAVKRLRNRPYAIERIWDAIETYDPTASVSVAEKPKRKPPQRPAAAREPRKNSKREQLIELVSRKSGATIDELCEKFGWQRHTVRGLLSTLNSKGVIKVDSAKNRKGQRVYRASSRE